MTNSPFSQSLLHWHRTQNHRVLPWKGISDPYKIWLSEVMLQQTRAEQGLPYYEKFTNHYPTIQDLAAADDDAVFKDWQGLGYYARCRNMLATARMVTSDFGGKFPSTYAGLLSLKGVGEYTAAAIGSFAFGLPVAVVDGNVIRVLARVFGIAERPDSTVGKKLFRQKADEVLDASDSAAFNQAIMDLGATICTPANPKCPACPLNDMCVAYQTGQTHMLPIPKKRPEIRHRHFGYLLLSRGEKLWMRRRPEGDVWAGLYEPYLLESATAPERREAEHAAQSNGLVLSAGLQLEGDLVQQLTHQRIHLRFFSGEISQPFPGEEAGVWADRAALRDLPLPRALALYFENRAYF